MVTFNLDNITRQAIGFDNLFNSMLSDNVGDIGYPPYNLIKEGEDTYLLQFALAGFKDRELDVQVKENKLTIDKEYFKIEPKMANAIDIKDLSFKYFNSDVYIFENFSLSIEKNKHTVITGPNGSGKSTLLGLIAKVFYPQVGNISSFTDKVGYVGVTPLILNGSLRDNFLYGNKEIKSDEELITLMNTFQLFNNGNTDLDYKVDNKTLSSGQMQKVAFIRSLVADVELLLLDESTSNLDLDSRKLIFDILQNRGITIINSTHSHEDFSYDKHLRIYLKENKRLIFIKKNIL